MSKIDGIKGLTAKEPIGVVASIGRKGPSGAPMETDRFFLVAPTAEKVGQIEVRPPHPAFRAFNDSTDLQARQVLRGQIVHRTAAECFEHHLTAQVLPGYPAHPGRAPHCTGDGTRAQRWVGDLTQQQRGQLVQLQKDRRPLEAAGLPLTMAPVPCPNDLCEYRQGEKKACGAWGRVLFRLRWKEGSPLPGLLCKLATKSWFSVASLLGFFEALEQQAAILGGDLGIYGVPLLITLGRKTMASRGRAFPVMSISVDGDLQAFLVQRAAWHRQALGERVQPLALTDGEQQAAEELAADLDGITPTLPMDQGGRP